MKKKLVECMLPPKYKKTKERYIAIARMPADGLCTVDYIDTETDSIEVRICLTKKEWMNYYPEDGSWDSKDWNNVCPTISLHLIEIKNESYVNRITSNHTIIAHQENIRWKQTQSRRERRIEALEARCASIPELTEGMKEWLTMYVGMEHWLYYKRKGRYVDFACTACGKSGTAITKTITLEDSARLQFEEIPSHNSYSRCPLCGAHVHAKAAGRTKGVFERRDHRSILQVVGEDVVVRCFEPAKYFDGNCETATEKIETYEVARKWVLKGKLQIDYKKYDPYIGKEFWDDCNLSGLSNITIHPGKTYRGNMKDLATSRYRYSMLEKVYAENDYMDVADYLMAYNKFPQLEMLVKLGMTQLAKELVENYHWEKGINSAGKNIKQIFGISKKRFEDLKNQNGGMVLLKVYQMEQKFGLKMSEEQLKVMTVCNLTQDQYVSILKHGTFEKVYNYIIKQSGVNPEAVTKCSSAERQFRETMIRYVDYLIACEDNERPMTDPHEVYPADITEAHNREILLKNQNKNEIEMKKKNKENPNIKKDAAGYNRQYRFEDSNYLIRAPKDAGEIFMEGLVLNHCVGRMGYIESMNRHETLILFLRKKKNKKQPYYTLEIKNGMIQQAYGYKDKKPDWEEVKPFLDAFKVSKLKKQKIENKVAVAG